MGVAELWGGSTFHGFVINTDSQGRYSTQVGLLQGWGGNPGTSYRMSAGIEAGCLTQVTVQSMQDMQADIECGRTKKPPNPDPPCEDEGAPVNVLTGNVWFTQQDVTLPGRGNALAVVRQYNSDNGNRNIGGTFGRGWHHTYEKTLSVLTPQILQIRDGDGLPRTYMDGDGDLTYTAYKPVTDPTWVVKSAQGTYTRYFQPGGSESYDAAGRLTSQTDATGNVVTLTYDASGRLASVSDGGRSLSFEYDAASTHVARLSGPDGLIASYGYDGNGLLAKVSYPDGSGYTFIYDSASFWHITEVTDFSGRVVERHGYDAQGRGATSELQDSIDKHSFAYSDAQTTVTDAQGNVTSYDWTAIRGVRYVTRITGPCAGCGGGGGGEVRQWTYDDLGRITAYTNGAGKTTTYTYYPDNTLETETNPLNKTTTYTYDAQGRMLTRAGPGGSLTTYVQGPSGPTSITEKVTSSQNRTTGITYTALGKPWTITDPRAKVTTLGYNGFGDLTSVTDPLTHATTFGYDTMGRRTTVTDALTHVTTTSYDARGRVSRITQNDGTHTDFTYDGGGRRTSVTDPLGRVTTYVYDPYGRLQTVLDPLGQATSYGYDAMSNLTSLTDANGHTTVFDYDGYNRVKKVTYPSGAFESFTYDAGGRLATKSDRKNVTATYSYYGDGRLWKKEYSGGSPPVSDPPVVFTYDDEGRLKTAANGTDTLTWNYDLAGQVLSEQSSKNASTVAYTYDLGGNRLTLSLDGTLYISYGYDDSSRLTTITRGTLVACPSLSSFCFGYDDANRRTSMTYPNGVSTAYTYDDLNRLLRLKADKGASPITDFQYTYDNAGNRTRKQQLDYTEDYSYDPLYRLTGVERSGGLTGLWQYGYDPVGNRIVGQQDNTVSTSVYSEKNQLLSSSGGGPLRWRGSLNEPGNVTFTSALVNGKPAKMLQGNVFEAMLDMTQGNNTVTVQATDVSGNVTTKGYQVNVAGAGTTYSHDPNGNLTSKTEGSDTWTYEWDAGNQLKRVTRNGLEVARSSYDALGRRVEKVAGGTTTSFAYDIEDILRRTDGPSVTKYVHGSGIDEPLASDDGSTLTGLHADALGSPIKTTNSAGAVLASARYTAFGSMETSGLGTYGFTGREPDVETGLAYYRARYYDPNAGRFVTEDPVGVLGQHLYSYSDALPTTLSDPFGLWPTGPAGAYQLLFCLKNPLACAPPIPRPVCMLRSFGSEFYGAWQRGKKGGPGAWRYAHCMASCRSRRDCNIPPAVVSAAGQAWEWTQVYTCVTYGDRGSCHSARAPQDAKDNAKGYSCPVGRDCAEQCHDLEGQDKGQDMYGPWQHWAE